ncbi:protein REPRESSOR OF SILENCING 3 [Mercurialis annua]|uniref:protein REPRESSOR OF SILENCING 3 n=1 Tax=Mercurialis annua TaxID=3986 RepID=UPI00215FC481|nr:protein REPRESSOR OF SILENCING 3 [Mercurialis annua]
MEVEGEGEDNNLKNTVPERVRIHVGGLGDTVTEDELHNLFSKLGLGFQSVEIIRTKGRSFAYIDFSPQSVSSLTKLFSTYNGCVWKGRKLRLEKAKEHYLDRMKREWAEDAEPASGAFSEDVEDDVDKKTEFSTKPMKDLSSEKKQLTIFFPGLQKLKSIPFNGTGKHKYSFRNFEVPSLPKHFCDCEEHSGSLSAKENQIAILEEQGGGMNEKEVGMMNSVMNRLFKMHNVPEAAHTEIERTEEEDYSKEETADPQLDESEGYSTEDEDGLILNVVSQRKERSFTNQIKEPKSMKRKTYEDRPAQEVLKKKTRNTEENHTNQYESAIARGNGSLHAHSNEPGSGNQHIESQPSVKQSATGAKWSQKSSWRELVGDKSNGVVNISDIFPAISSKKKEETEPDATLHSIKKKNKRKLTNKNWRSQLDKSEGEGLVEAQPTQGLVETQPTQGLVEAQPTQGLVEAQPAQVLVEAQPAQGLVEAQPTQVLVEAQPAQVLVEAQPAQGLVEAQPALGLVEAQPTQLDFGLDKAGRGSAWLQKASWTQLVHCNSSFSISQILPGVKFDKQEPIKTGKSESCTPVTSSGIERNDDVKSSPKSDQLIVMGDNNGSAPAENKKKSANKQEGGVVAIDTPVPSENKNNAPPKRKVVTIGESRPFMRTQESVKEWENIRAALSGSRKRSIKGK